MFTTDQKKWLNTLAKLPEGTDAYIVEKGEDFVTQAKEMVKNQEIADDDLPEGAYKTFTKGQWEFIQSLHCQVTGEPQPERTGRYKPILVQLQQMMGGTDWPVIKSGLIHVIVNGPNSKHAGGAKITNGKDYDTPENVWYGALTKGGVYISSRSISDDDKEYVKGELECILSGESAPAETLDELLDDEIPF